jgi:glutathione S-transferase
MSSIDLFGKGFVLLAGPQGEAWCDAARAAARKFENLPLEAYCVGSAELHDPDGGFVDAYGLSASGAVLVRPDGFIAWRCKSLEEHPDAILIGVLGSVLRGLPVTVRPSAPPAQTATSPSLAMGNGLYQQDAGAHAPQASEPVTSWTSAFNYTSWGWPTASPVHSAPPPPSAVQAAAPSVPRSDIVHFDYVWDYAASAAKDPEFDVSAQRHGTGNGTVALRAASPMTLYMHPVSMTSRPVRLFIAESGIRVDEQLVDVMTGEHLKPPYAALNPNSLVPMLVDGDLRLTESSAILKYLADKIDSPAYPRDLKKRAKIDEMMDWLNTQFYRDWAYGLCYPQLFPHHKRRSDEAHAGAIAWGKQNSKKWLQLLNDHWIGPRNRYLCGNEITIADYFGSGLVSLGEVVHTDFNKYPNVARWLGAIKRLKSWDRVNEVFTGLVNSTKGQVFESV